MAEQLIPDEKELVRWLNTGEDAAFKAVYRKFYGMVLNTANRYVRDAATAEDLAQGIFEKMWNNRTTVVIHTSLSSYLRTTAVNESLNYIKKQQRFILNEPDDWTDLSTEPGEAELQAEKYDLEDALHKAIAMLPERCRIVFSLSRFEKLSHKEISEKLEISTKTIENQITKAVKMVREVLLKYKELSSIVILYINMFLGK